MRLSSLSSTSRTVFPFFGIHGPHSGYSAGPSPARASDAISKPTSATLYTMSYAAPAGKRDPSRSRVVSTGKRPPARKNESDWQQVAVFCAGLALGILVGAGAALLTAPQSGREARSDIRHYARRKRRALGRRSRDAWLDLRDELRDAARSLRRRRRRAPNERPESPASPPPDNDDR